MGTLRAAANTMPDFWQKFDITKEKQVEAIEDEEKPFHCELLGPDGRVCGRAFSTMKSLSLRVELYEKMRLKLSKSTCVHIPINIVSQLGKRIGIKRTA